MGRRSRVACYAGWMFPVLHVAYLGVASLIFLQAPNVCCKLSGLEETRISTNQSGLEVSSLSCSIVRIATVKSCALERKGPH